MEPIIAKDTGGGYFERHLPDVGQHQFVLSKIHDLGMQEVTWNGESKWQHKVMFTYELDQKIEDEGSEYNGKRMLIHEELTLSLGDKAKLAERLQTWRGKELTEDERRGFDITKVLGVQGTMNIMHRTSKTSGREYAVVASLAPPVKGAPIMEPELPEDWCPEWIQKKIDAGWNPGGDVSQKPEKEEEIPF